MKLLIAGSRNIFPTVDHIDAWVTPTGKITEIVSGGAKGVDLAGEAWARANGVPVKRFLPDWSLGKKAGPIRNKAMVEYADKAVIVWDGKSRGTKNTLDYLEASGKPFIIWYP